MVFQNTFHKCCVSLKSLNTFSINVFANRVIPVYNEYMLFRYWLQSTYHGDPVIILGDGSNVLFLENYFGTILLNRIKGIIVTEDMLYWKLHVGAGEQWNKLVVFTIFSNMPGLENLACIPGRVGAAFVQNIGAYGMEISQVCEYVDVLDLHQGKKIRFNCSKCHFGYRSSLFRIYSNKYVVIFVGIRLCKFWKPVLSYRELKFLNTCSNITPRQIFSIIRIIRYNKLPNPVFFGNAGSFFKNPIVTIKKARAMIRTYPDMPFYRINGVMKLSAGWLIENCGLKGYVFGEVSVYSKQAVVLINNRQMATGTEIVALAYYIFNKVLNQFNIFLQPEVRFIGRFGEINSKKIFLRY